MQHPVRFGQDVHAGKGGVAFRDLGQHGPGGVGQDRFPQVVGAQQGQVVAPGQAGHPGRLERSWYVPDGPHPPRLGEFLEAGVGLGRAGGDSSYLVQAHVLDGGGLSAMGGGELCPQLGGVGGDLAGALGELVQEGLGHPGHLEAGPGRMAALSLLPAEAEGGGQQVGQGAVVQLGERGHRLVQGAGVECAPAPVGGALSSGPGQYVVVELGVVCAAGPVAEADRDHAGHVFFDHAVGARTGAEHLGLGVRQHHFHGPAVAGVDDRLPRRVGQGPGHRHGLGRAAGEVEAGHRHPAPRRPGHPSDRLAADRVGTGREHALQVLLADLGAGDYAAPAVEVGQAGAHEHPRRGTGGGVVAGQGIGALSCAVAGGHRAQQVAVAPAQADPADRDQRRLPGPRPGRRPS